MLSILKRAVLRGFASFALVFLLTWLSGWALCVTMLSHYVGQKYPLYPSLSVTYPSLLLDMIPTALFSGIAAGISGACLPFLHWRYGLMAVLYTVGLYIAGDAAAFLFQFDSGTTWGPGEAFMHFIWNPVIYPMINVLGLAVIGFVYWQRKGNL